MYNSGKNDEIENLMQIFSSIQGIGPRSSRRITLQLIRERETLLKPLINNLTAAAANIKTCEDCGNIDVKNPCNICSNDKRDKSILCIVEDLSDLWAIERSGIFSGKYHMLGGTLSAINGVGPEKLNMTKLKTRIDEYGIKEIIIATNQTSEGQITAHYIVNFLEDISVKISRLARGIPIGGELDYMDDGTLSTAIKDRVIMEDV